MTADSRTDQMFANHRFSSRLLDKPMSVVRMSKQMNSLIVRCDKLVETFSHKDDLYVIIFSSLQYASMFSNQKCRLHAAYTCTVCAGNGRWCRLDIGSPSYFVDYCNIFHSQVESCCRGPCSIPSHCTFLSIKETYFWAST